MRTLLTALAVLVLAACGTPQPLESNAGGSVIAVATLSTNACEAAASPFITAAAVRVQIAAAQIRKGQLSPADGRKVAALADDAVQRLTAACPKGVTAAGAADPAISHARTRITEIERILSGGRQ